MTKYIIQDSEAGNQIAEFDSLAEAEKEMAAYEEADKKEGCYVAGFYEIVTR